MGNSSSFKVRNHWTHGVALVLVVRCCRRDGVWVGNNLQVVWLHHSPQRVQEHTRIIRCPQVNIECVDPVHVFAMVVRVRHWKVPLGHVLLGGRSRAAMLAAKCINS